jgi:hypothetical protein
MKKENIFKTEAKIYLMKDGKEKDTLLKEVSIHQADLGYFGNAVHNVNLIDDNEIWFNARDLVVRKAKLFMQEDVVNFVQINTKRDNKK